jgi:putative Mn2+ efflux pump MntP
MSFFHIIAIAIALAMDAFAVAIATGVSLRAVNARQVFRLAWHFGLFQTLMPIIGWTAGLSVQDYIEHYDHWIAFALLMFVGGNMIREALAGPDDTKERKDPTRGATMVMLSVATSIDALAVGLSIAMLKISIWYPAVIIGIVAGSFTILGLKIGQKVAAAKRLSHYAEIMGGLVLIGIGINILYQHGIKIIWPF